MPWAYIARGGGAALEDTYRLAVEEHFIWRPPFNVNGDCIPNVGNVVPGDIMCLYYAGGMAANLLAVCIIVGGNDLHNQQVPDPRLHAVYFYGGNLDLAALGYPVNQVLIDLFGQPHAGFTVDVLEMPNGFQELLHPAIPQGLRNSIVHLENLVPAEVVHLFINQLG